MAFIDLDKKIPDSFSIPEADITIIGAGAAGILLAVKLSAEGKRVLLVESGAYKEDEKKQKLNTVGQDGKVLQNAVWGRKRAIGGTTIAWGGQSLPFTPLDFEQRDWVENSGWPIGFEEMAPYYRKANSFMGIDKLNYTSDIFPKILFKNPGIDDTIFNLHVSKWGRQPDFYKLYKNRLEKDVTVIYNAQLISIIKKTDIVSSVVISNFNSKLFQLNINHLIIAAGTIETVRLLLTNDVGQQSGWLGKCFMEHPSIEVGTIITKDMYTWQRYFNTHIWKGKRYSLRLSLNSRIQEQSKLLNCSSSIMFQLPDDSFDPYGEIKSFKKDFKFYRLLKISRSIPSILKSVYAYLRYKFYYKPGASAKLSLMVEQEPITDSKIVLSDKKDRFDIPEAVIRWDISYKTWLTVFATSDLLKEELENLKLGSVNIYSHINKNTIDWSRHLSDVCHHMGGSRMSATADLGVVNKDLQVWGISNLHICSCSVFPTSSHSNPTLTLLALAARLSDHLSKKDINVAN